MKITSCRFERAAYGPGDEPRKPGAHVLFLGRSNVGKSSLINRLLGARNLARTSSRPGRTQSVNFYRVNESFYFVDLPGYGFARVPERVRRDWKPMVDGYLHRHTPRVAAAVLLVDARHEPTELDRMMRDWLKERKIPYLVAAVKADKLSRNARAVAGGGLREALGTAPLGEDAVLASSATGEGIRQIWRHLEHALASAAKRRPVGSRTTDRAGAPR